MTTDATPDLVMVDPSSILADDNIRFSLKKSKIDSLAEKIKEAGRVNDPIEIMPLPEAVDGKDYRLSVGHYRLAAVIKLMEEGTPIQLPAIVRERSDLDRRRRQLSENRDRENLSPMDCAVAFKYLQDSGMSKMDIRKEFMRPGGAKGNKVQPISNALMNMYLSFLDFPKAIQNKIHLGPEEGGIGVQTAYQLSKCDKDKWEPILAKAEADRLAAIEQEDKDEEKYLASERKADEAKLKAAEEEAKLKAAKDAVTKAQADVAVKREAAIKAYEAAKSENDDKAREEKEAALKKAEDEGRAAERAAATAKKELDKAEGKVKSAAAVAEERRKKLEAARKEEEKGKKAKAAPKPADVQKAAKELGDGSGRKALNIAEVREGIKRITLPGTTPKVLAIGTTFGRFMAGELTDSQMYTELQKLVGEYVDKKKK
jgi:ParB/RepB/Spo0J family partition protein